MPIALQMLRFFTLFLLVLGAIQDLLVVLWYTHAGLFGPRKIWHVLSVGLGLLLAYVAMALEIVRLLVEHSTWVITSPLLISSSLFLMFGVHQLWFDARRRAGRRR